MGNDRHIISSTETRNYVGQFSVHFLESDKMLDYWLSFYDLSGFHVIQSNKYSSKLTLECENSNVEVWVPSSISVRYSFVKNEFFSCLRDKPYILSAKFPTLVSLCLFSNEIIGKNPTFFVESISSNVIYPAPIALKERAYQSDHRTRNVPADPPQEHNEAAE